jgi:hypothetical protein
MDFHFVRSRLSFSPGSAFVFAGILLVLVPVALTTLLIWKRKTWRPNMAAWRWRVWNGGLAVAAMAAVALPIFLLGIQFLSEAAKDKWFINAGMRGMFFALLIAPVAMILLGFGKGRQRWMGMLTCLISSVLLYASLLAASY